MSFQTDFGDALRAARKRAGWSQTELAQRSGVHLNTVSQVERGEADPRLSTLQALGQTVGLNLYVSAMPRLAAMPDSAFVKYPPFVAQESLQVNESSLPAFLQAKK